MAGCRHQAILIGETAIPRSCHECGLGPCKNGIADPIKARRLRDEEIAKRQESWNDIKPHDAITGEITSIEFAVDNPTQVVWISENAEKSDWRKEADRLLDLIEGTKNRTMILDYLHSLYCHVSSRLRP